jgi:hypothetical protein
MFPPTAFYRGESPAMSRRPSPDRATSFSLSQIIFGLDDRNLLPAIRMLEPAAESAEPYSGLDPDEQPRCLRCVTRGE